MKTDDHADKILADGRRERASFSTTETLTGVEVSHDTTS